MARDFKPFNWSGSLEINCRAADDTGDARLSQSRIMGNLLKALKLKLEREGRDLSNDEMVQFIGHYANNEQCFGYTEIFKDHPLWLEKVWNVVGAWNGEDLDDLGNRLSEAEIPRRTEGNILDEAILLLVEGYERHGLDDDFAVPDIIGLTYLDKEVAEINSLGQMTGRVDDDGLAAILNRIKDKEKDVMVEISVGSHSTAAMASAAGFVTFDPDHPDAFCRVEEAGEAANFLWRNLSHGDSHISVDVDVFHAGSESPVFVLDEQQELARATLEFGQLKDLFQIFLYNMEMSEYLIGLIKDEGYAGIAGINGVTGPGGESWSDVLNQLKDHFGKDNPMIVSLESETIPGVDVLGASLEALEAAKSMSHC